MGMTPIGLHGVILLYFRVVWQVWGGWEMLADLSVDFGIAPAAFS